MTTATVETNYSLFINTVKSLAHSQGFYSRIAAQIDNMSDFELKELKEKINSLDIQFKDSVDVVLWLEQ